LVKSEPVCKSDPPSGQPDERSLRKALQVYYAEVLKAPLKDCVLWKRPIDLDKLYTVVATLGGYEQVTARKMWRRVGSLFHPPQSCTNLSFLIRTTYQARLLEFERAGEYRIPPAPDADLWLSTEIKNAKSDYLAGRSAKPNPGGSAWRSGRARRACTPACIKRSSSPGSDSGGEAEPVDIPKRARTTAPTLTNQAVVPPSTPPTTTTTLQPRSTIAQVYRSNHRRKPRKTPSTPPAASKVVPSYAKLPETVKRRPRCWDSLGSTAADWGDNLIGRRIRFMLHTTAGEKRGKQDAVVEYYDDVSGAYKLRLEDGRLEEVRLQGEPWSILPDGESVSSDDSNKDCRYTRHWMPQPLSRTPSDTDHSVHHCPAQADAQGDILTIEDESDAVKLEDSPREKGRGVLGEMLPIVGESLGIEAEVEDRSDARADFVKITVSRTEDTYKLHVLVTGMLHDEVKVTCDNADCVNIRGSPKDKEDPSKATTFFKVVRLPRHVVPNSTSASMTSEGHLLVSVPIQTMGN